MHPQFSANRRASDKAVAMHTLQKGYDSIDAPNYADGSVSHGNVNDGCRITATTSLVVSLQFAVSMLFLPSKPRRKLRKRSSNWYRRTSPTTSCVSFRMVCQLSKTYKSCTHLNRFPTPTRTRLSTPRPCLPRESAISRSHGTLVILECAAMSRQTWRPKKGQLWSKKE